LRGKKADFCLQSNKEVTMEKLEKGDSYLVREENVKLALEQTEHGLPNGFLTNLWYFKKIFSDKELLCCYLLKAQMFDDIPDIRNITLDMEEMPSLMGISRQQLNKNILSLESKILECPICGNTIREGVILKYKEYSGRYRVDMTPLFEVIGHLEKHRLADTEAYKTIRSSFYQKDIDPKKLANLREARAAAKKKSDEEKAAKTGKKGKELKESNIIYFTERVG
jgi:hypothetical protein